MLDTDYMICLLATKNAIITNKSIACVFGLTMLDLALKLRYS